MSLASVAQSLPIITGVCLAMALSPEKAFALGWATGYTDTTDDFYNTAITGTGQGVDTVMALGPSIAGGRLASAGGSSSAYSEMRGGNAAGVSGLATYYDAQGNPTIPNSGYTWTGTWYSSTMFTVASNYSINKSTGLLTPIGNAHVEVDDGGVSGYSAENLPVGYMIADSPPNANTIGGYMTSQTGPNVAGRGATIGTSTSEVAIGGVYYFQNGNLSWASEGGSCVWANTFQVTTTRAAFQQSSSYSCGSDIFLDKTVLNATESSGSSAGVISVVHVTLSGALSNP